MNVIVGVDIGGTFTDICLYDEKSRQLWLGKTLTTPSDPAKSFLEGVRQTLGKANLKGSQITKLIHATTLIANTLIERKGVPTGLLTTLGFEDVLEMRTESRYDHYDLFLELPPPLVRRSLRVGIKERVGPQGQIICAPEIDSIKEAMGRFSNAGVESIAICFLHSYVNSANEKAALQSVKEFLPEVTISLSCEVRPEIREYERFSTTVANAYVQPRVFTYLKDLESTLSAIGISAHFQIMLSNGGVTRIERATQTPIELIESGPAAGAIAAAYIGDLTQQKKILSFDMGGTTAKIATIWEGHPRLTTSFEAARVSRFKRGSGIPLLIPTVDLIEIGAGGGSIACVNAMGIVQVGPESAGADPGPACYGRGGIEPTVTDADLILGYLNPEYFLGGDMVIDKLAGEKALNERIGKKLGYTSIEAALAIEEVVNEQMASACRIQFAEQGEDSREYTLVAFGGAGPIHACVLAQKLGISKIICPPGAGLASCLGLLLANPRVDLVRTVIGELKHISPILIQKLYEEMAEEALKILGVTADDQVVQTRYAELRYKGQGYQIEVALPHATTITEEILKLLEQDFKKSYEKLFGTSPTDISAEAVHWRLTAEVPKSASFSLWRADGSVDHGSTDPISERMVWLPKEGWGNVPCYRRDQLLPGMTIKGPAIIEERESTTIIPSHFKTTIDPHHNLFITHEKEN